MTGKTIMIILAGSRIGVGPYHLCSKLYCNILRLKKVIRSSYGLPFTWICKTFRRYKEKRVSQTATLRVQFRFRFQSSSAMPWQGKWLFIKPPPPLTHYSAWMLFILVFAWFEIRLKIVNGMILKKTCLNR